MVNTLENEQSSPELEISEPVVVSDEDQNSELPVSVSSESSELDVSLLVLTLAALCNGSNVGSSTSYSESS